MEISIEVPEKTKNRPTYDPAMPLLVIYPKECESIYKRDTCTPVFIAALFTIAKMWNKLSHDFETHSRSCPGCWWRSFFLHLSLAFLRNVWLILFFCPCTSVRRLHA
jgi:hypothetical protein